MSSKSAVRALSNVLRCSTCNNERVIYALIIYLLTLQNQGAVDVWLFYYNPAGKIAVENEYCLTDSPTISECLIPEGVTSLELKITAPCSLANVPVLVSEDWKGRRRKVYWTNIPNSAPCVRKLFFPFMPVDSDTKPYQPR